MLLKLSSLPSVRPQIRLNIPYLYSYQRQGIARLAQLFEANINPILAFPMGLGKTVTTLALLTHLWEKSRTTPATPLPPDLVVAPTEALAHQWKTEFLTKLSGVTEDDVLVITSSDEIPPEEVTNRYRMVITTHKVLREQIPSKKKAEPSAMALDLQPLSPTEHHGPEAGHKRKKFKPDDDATAQKLASRNWHCVIFDEIHHEKSPLTKLFKSSSEFNNAYYKLGLTGTPIARSLHDLYAELLAMNPSDDQLLSERVALTRTSTVLTSIEQRAHHGGIYTGSKRCTTFPDLISAHIKSLPKVLMTIIQIRKLLQSHFIRVTKASVQDELMDKSVPQALRKEYTVTATQLPYGSPGAIPFHPPRQLTTYRSIFNVSGRTTQAPAESEHPSSPLSTYAKQSRTGTFESKKKAFLTYFGQQNGAMVVSLDTQTSRTQLKRELMANGITVFDSKEQGDIERFNRSCAQKKKAVILIPTVCEGLNLSKAPTLFIWDQPRSALEEDQLAHRVDRIGQKCPTVSIVSFTPQTDYEKYLAELCEFQQTLVDTLLKNPLEFLRNTLVDILQSDKSPYKADANFGPEAVQQWLSTVFSGIDFDTVNEEDLHSKLESVVAPPPVMEAMQSAQVASAALPLDMDPFAVFDQLEDSLGLDTQGFFGDFGPLDDGLFEVLF